MPGAVATVAAPRSVARRAPTHWWARPLIVADYAPALCLVARGKARVVVVGSGFTVPPLADPLPPIRPWDEAVPGASLDRERRVLAACTAIARANDLLRPECAAELLHDDATFACCLPPLDPYAHRRPAPTLTPYAGGNPPAPVPLDERPRGSTLVYLPARHPLAEIVGQCLGEQLGPALPNRCAEGFLRAVTAARLVVHHGGLGTAQLALLAGIPQLVLPTHLEDHLTARALTRLGVARTFPAAEPTSAARISRALRDLASQPVAGTALSAAMAARSGRDPEDTLAAVLTACLRH